ncbi:MAG: hypothetical protein M3Y13_09935, partial [Armatimonadota bacterium]|nr:hypothetical protein [Armatimonadota bacterium]
MMFATKTISGLLLGTIFWLAALAGAQAGENRYWMAVQQDFGGKKGYVLDFENSSTGDTPITLKTLKIIAGVGDRAGWHFYTAIPDWKYNHDYAIVATFGPKGAELVIDGEKVAGGEGALVPDTGPTLTNYIPEWAHSPAEYLIEQTSLQMTTDKGHRRDFDFPPPRSLSLMLFEPQMPQEPQKAQAWNLQPGETLTVKTTIRLLPMPTDLHALAPFIDRYGQAIAADWPGKIKTDSDLVASLTDENRRLAKMGTPTGYDASGGVLNAGWHERPTGYFHTIKHLGFWWLLTPQGNP